ncbi:YggT family protein [Devriesea agamarum]|uniref:YggT family protein n=1 Tax=Devriesea agamarum TaxID=472569 RepID=UPI00071CE70D|nr:YggT family protein [Devriesea agamarum]
MQLIVGIAYLAVLLYMIALITRLVLEWIQAYARDFRPRGLVLILFEVVYTVTDPPVSLARRLIPPLRFGGIALDLGLFIVLILCSVILSILGALVS